MHPLATLGAAAVVAAGAAYATVRFTAAPPPIEPTGAVDTARLARDLAELRQQFDRLVAAPGAVEAAAPSTSTSDRQPIAVITDEQIRDALARYLELHGDAVPGTAATHTAVADVATSLATLRGNSSFWSNGELYKRLFAAGKMDELIAAFEQSAETNPRDVQAQMDLGNAYLAYLQLDQSKWPLSQKADSTFDRVLAIDENHWAARFTKAVSYTFWPDFLGKKKPAIEHFERLVEQQDQMPPRPEFAQTYFFLGNLLEQRGEGDRAREIWARGLRLHPDNAQLREKLGR